MNANKWETRIVRLSVGAMAVLGMASAMVGLTGLMFGHRAVRHAGVMGLAVTTAIGAAGITAIFAVRTVGTRPRRPGRRCPVRGYSVL